MATASVAQETVRELVRELVREQRAQNRDNPTEVVVARVQTRADVAPFAYVVGAWVWVEFPGRPGEDTRTWLLAQGFSWNSTRAVWQHTGGVYRHQSNGDPRYTYGMSRVAVYTADTEEAVA